MTILRNCRRFKRKLIENECIIKVTRWKSNNKKHQSAAKKACEKSTTPIKGELNSITFHTQNLVMSTHFLFTNNASLPFKTQCSREKRNQEAIQLAVLIGLASQICTLTVEKPPKKSNVTQQIPRVVSLDFGNEVVELGSFVKTRFKNLLDNSYRTETERVKALRIYNRNVHVFTNNYLIDILTENGFFFNSHLSKVSKNTQRIEYFDQVFFNGTFFMSLSQMAQRGKALCNFFNETACKPSNSVLVYQDQRIADILKVPKRKSISNFN
ncbi:hypothetical protein EIN_430740 [Entamoeba invadens IP1]|uniref:Uncharacterized protein n=1 Tax=Entamoeba invadens IP1 TaxID=370355 RepID=A0A0A1UFI1_ENTIV|nr:hypothetical protein EIN_430740 [Entamoeba invadens IP1]ELP95268.1 hypothetical protein EIN_430740 [Entamoeba invadens IP1]|eukprot:XP_004262039.1 hypothetical protein EIN_430740 [Entamoeba invadens IP1]